MNPKYYRVNTLVHSDIKRKTLDDFANRYPTFRAELTKYVGSDQYTVFGAGKEKWDSIIVCLSTHGSTLHCVKIYERFFKAAIPEHIDAILDYADREHATTAIAGHQNMGGFIPTDVAGLWECKPTNNKLPKHIVLYNYNSQCPESKVDELVSLITVGLIDEGVVDRDLIFRSLLINDQLGKIHSEVCDTLVYKREDGVIIGMVMYEHNPNQVASITSLVVDRNYRRQGIATELLNAVSCIPHVVSRIYCTYEIENKGGTGLFSKSPNFTELAKIYTHKLDREKLVWNVGEMRGNVKRFDVA